MITTESRPWYREPMVWLLIAIPLAAVVMGIATITLAILSDDGMVADDYYRRGLLINRSLERDRVATRLGLSAELNLDNERRLISVALRTSNTFVAPASVSLGLYHATRSGHDHELTLYRSGDRYEGVLPRLVDGRWYLQVYADDWRLNGVAQVPAHDLLIIEHYPELPVTAQ